MFRIERNNENDKDVALRYQSHKYVRSVLTKYVKKPKNPEEVTTFNVEVDVDNLTTYKITIVVTFPTDDEKIMDDLLSNIVQELENINGEKSVMCYTTKIAILEQ